MSLSVNRAMRGLCVLAAFGLVSSCGLPRVGPNKREIFAGSVQQQGDAFILTVTDRVNAIAGAAPASGFSDAMRSAGVLGADTINPGDRLSLTIWENVDDGILVGSGQNATALNDVEVDSQGFIFVPYAGRIRAAGNSPEAVRRIISERLGQQTPDPQVQVSRAAGDGATVALIGMGGAQGVQEITRATRTLTAMLASAGGIGVDPQSLKVTVIRGGHRGTIFFEDLAANPANDIALRNGDTIILETDTRSFTSLGATGGQSEVKFETRSISAIEAIARVGGLNPMLADPTGIFIFRNESEQVTEALTGQDVTGGQRVVYLLDITAPNGVFLARDFEIRDGDTVYVTEAPFVQFNKTISALTGSMRSANATAGLAQTTFGVGN